VQVHPLYLEVKGLVCCELANLIGDLWLALLLASIFAVATAAAVFAFVAQLDALPQRGCVQRLQSQDGCAHACAC